MAKKIMKVTISFCGECCYCEAGEKMDNGKTQVFCEFGNKHQIILESKDLQPIWDRIVLGDKCPLDNV